MRPKTKIKPQNPMNTALNRKTIGLAALLALALAFIVPAASAGPGPEYWRNLGQVKTQKEAKEIKPDSTVMLVCGACKTVKLADFKSPQTNGRPPLTWTEVGSKHDCEHCGGSITVVHGKTKDEMQHNCSMCGTGAAFCCAMPPAPEKKS